MPVTLLPPLGDRLTDAEIDPWREVPVAIAVDLIPGQQIYPRIRPISSPGAQPKLVGRAVTALCEPPDFGAVLHALELVGSNDVLVIGAGGRSDAAMIGEILSGFLRARGAAGVVCDGAVRDVEMLSSWDDFAVFARAVNPRGPTGAERGVVNAVVSIHGSLVRPGDLILGDDDGLVALSRENVRSRLDDAKAKLALEAEWVESLANGRSVAETFGLAPAIEVEEP